MRREGEHAVQVGAKRKFEMLQYTGEDMVKVYRNEGEVDRFVPWSVFLREGVAPPQVELARDFQDRVDDPMAEAVHRRGMWLVPLRGPLPQDGGTDGAELHRWALGRGSHQRAVEPAPARRPGPHGPVRGKLRDHQDQGH